MNNTDCGGECHNDCIKDDYDRSACDPGYQMEFDFESPHAHEIINHSNPEAS